MKVEKQMRKVEKVVEVEEPVYILEMSEIDIQRIKELLGNITIGDFDDIMDEDPSSWPYRLGKDEDGWLIGTYKSLKAATNQ